MKRAMTIGLATGVVLSLLFVGAGLIRDSILLAPFTQQWFYLGIFLVVIFSTLWISMNYFSRANSIQWGILNICGITSAIVAAFIFSVTSYLFTRYIDPGYLSSLQQSNAAWEARHLSTSSFTGSPGGNGFNSPLNFAISNFQTAIFLLGFMSVATSTIYYWRRKNRSTEPVHHRNHELIY